MERFYFINHILYFLLQFSWGIVQNILGLGLFLILLIKEPKDKKEFYHGAIVVNWQKRSSMGLGLFIFFGHSYFQQKDLVKAHEYGHTLQSLILGPLFLPIIALPSLYWANSRKMGEKRRKENRSYYSLYCERWANRLAAGVLKLPTNRLK